MAIPSIETAFIIISLLPIWIAILAAITVGGWVIASRLRRSGSDALANNLLYMVGAVFVILILIHMLRWCVTPVEAFDDGPTDSISQLLTDISALEAVVCPFMTQTDQFLQNDVGPAGQENPALVVQEQSRARAAAIAAGNGSGLTDCSGDPLADADTRISRIKLTLNSFTGPEFLKAYNAAKASQTCEGFVSYREYMTVSPSDSGSDSGPDIKALRARLTAAQSVANIQQTQYLTPIQNMTSALQKGQASDCQKKNGATRALAPPS